MKVAVFGVAPPLGVFASIGLAVEDISLRWAARGTAADRYLEPFMDPFMASVLRGLAAGDFADFGAIVFLRESPGALHAYLYACELQRRGGLPANTPALILINILNADSPAADRFNRAELDRLTKTLEQLGWRPQPTIAPHRQFADLIAAQAVGAVSGAGAFAARRQISQGATPSSGGAAAMSGPKIALLGAPLGNGALHTALDAVGHLVLDQQALDQEWAARGDDLTHALTAQASNPFAARQPKPVFVDAVAEALRAHAISRVFWQVEPHDDLWGWTAPQLRAVCETRGVRFTNLGFLERWPTAPQIAALRIQEVIA